MKLPKPEIEILSLGPTRHGTKMYVATLVGTKSTLTWEESVSKIWICATYTPPRQRNRGNARRLIAWIKSKHKPVDFGIFTADGEKYLRRYDKQLNANTLELFSLGGAFYCTFDVGYVILLS